MRHHSGILSDPSHNICVVLILRSGFMLIAFKTTMHSSETRGPSTLLLNMCIWNYSNAKNVDFKSSARKTH